MILLGNAITISDLADLIDSATVSLDRDDDYGRQIIDATALSEGLRRMSANLPQNLFSEIVGMSIDEAVAHLDNIHATNPGPGVPKNRYRTELPLVKSVTVFFDDGQETPALFERTGNLRGTSGMLTGEGLGMDGDLVVSLTNGVISEIITFGA